MHDHADDMWADWTTIRSSVEKLQADLYASVAATCDATHAELDVLLLLHGTPEARMRFAALAEAVSFTTGGFTKVADRLTDRGLAERVRCAADRRTVYLELTAAGRTMATAVRDEMSAYLGRHFVQVVGEPLAHDIACAMGQVLRGRTAGADPQEP
ncbi:MULTISPECIES: MarR family winged helix-turn-helix transcriptional regulator [Actinomycetes]|uniref:MarR family transcriptional regulator n=2 Tax=Actinomycetes TaxID=1760 RepID=A0ABP6M3J6_9MICC